MNLKTYNVTSKLLLISVLALAVLLQISTDISIGGSKLRLGLSDLIIPWILLLVIALNFNDKKRIFETTDKKIILIIGIITTWLIFSLVNGRIYMGEWQTWALVNKGAGWFVLLSYLLCGYLIVIYNQEIKERFLQVFFIASWLVGVCFLFKYALYLHLIISDGSLKRLSGLFSNPNAYGVLMGVILLLQLPYIRGQKLFPLWVNLFGAAVTILCMFFSGSRSALLGVITAVFIMMLLRRLDWRMALFALSIAINIGFIGNLIPPVITKSIIIYETYKDGYASEGEIKSFEKLLKSRGAKKIYSTRESFAEDSGVKHRIKLVEQAFELWKQSPIIGTGIGSFYWDQIKRGEANPSVIHNSAQWVLTEMGIIGVILFLILFLVILKQLHMSMKYSRNNLFVTGVFGLVLVAIGASAGTEIIYQRYLWLFIGMALAVCYSDIHNLIRS